MRQLEAAKEREQQADAKAAAAMRALEAANEATATAEQAASETARHKVRDALNAELCAVACDRMRTRRRRYAAGGNLWWELLGKRFEVQRAKPTTNERSGLAMLLDAVFLGAGNDAQAHLDSKLPTLLRETVEGREAERVVLHRQPRGIGWMHAFLSEACADKLLHDRAAERVHEQPLDLASFLVAWAPSRFGLHTTCMLNLWTLHQALVTHRPKSVEASTMMLFFELPATPRCLRVISFYLHARAYVRARASLTPRAARRGRGS